MFEAQATRIEIPVWRWANLIENLRRRGQGQRESGAFLLTQRGKRRVTSYVCYDDIDQEAYQRGAIAFHAAGYAALWKHCRERQLEVLADVHTHPGNGVGQSTIDQRHPMVPIVGHTALILPNFANTEWWTLKSVGIHEYLGDFKWRAHASRQSNRVSLCL